MTKNIEFPFELFDKKELVHHKLQKIYFLLLSNFLLLLYPVILFMNSPGKLKKIITEYTEYTESANFKDIKNNTFN